MSDACYRFSRFELDLVRGCLREGDHEVKLRPKAFAVLRVLIEQAGRLISKDELMAAVWPGIFVSDDSLVQCVREVRRALDDADQSCIQNVPGRGYLFALPVTNGASRPAPATVPEAEADETPRPDWSARAHRRALIGWAAAAGLCVVVAVGALAMRLFDGSASADAPSLTSVAVLPFEPVGDIQEGTAVALSDDLRAALVHRPAGPVAARQAGVGYPEAADATAIGRAFNVRFVVEGSVRRDGALVHVAVKLDDTATGTQPWARTLDVEAAALQGGWDELVTRLYVALDTGLTVVAAERSWQEHADHPSARDFEIRGRGLIRKGWGRANFLAARAEFEQALRLDPDSFEATVRLAQIDANAVLAHWTSDDADELARAEALDRAALVRRPSSAIAHFVRAILLRAYGDYEQAITAYQRTLELNPHMIWARAGIGRALIELGRFEEALPFLQTVLRIAPGDGDASGWWFLLGMSQLMLDRDEAAVLSLRKSIEMDPENVFTRQWMIAACGLTGRRDEAERELARVRTQLPEVSAARLFRNLVQIRMPADAAQMAHLRDGLRRAGVPD